MNKPPIDRLIFIYNADGGIVQGLLDTLHKALSPATYACSLCAITHGALRMDPKWRAWLRALPVETVFLHKDEVAQALPGFAEPLPVVLAERAGERELVLSAERLAALPDVDALIAALEGMLASATRAR